MFYNEGNLKYKSIFHEQNYDSIVFYYKNGKVFKTGKQNKKGKKYGKWNHYNIEGFLSETREYFIIKSDYKLNQIWFYNRKGDTIAYPDKKFNVYKQKEFESDIGFDSSIFIRIYCNPKKDTLKLLEKMSIDIENATPFWAKKGSECYVILAKQKHNFNSNFSNLNKVKIDTIYNSYSIKTNRSLMDSTDLRQRTGFDISFKTTGRKILRGYMIEHWKRNSTIKDSIKDMERIVYFEKVIYVKDTVRKKKNGL